MTVETAFLAMKKQRHNYILICVFGFCVTGLVIPALALAGSGDMFYGGDTTHPSQRPWVADEGPGNKDMFHAPQQQYPQDMYGHTSHTENPQGQDMLSGHLDHVPDAQLFQTPQNGLYK
jgi:hypothetical protein